MGWRDRGYPRAEHGTEFVLVDGETVLIATPEGGEVAVPLADLRELLVHTEWPLVGDSPFGLAYEQLQHEAARMRRRIDWERRRAPGELADLLARPEPAWEGAVAALADPTFSLAELALHRARELAPTDPKRSRALARLGRLVAERIPEAVYAPSVPRTSAPLPRPSTATPSASPASCPQAPSFARANRWLERGSEASVEALQVLELEVLLRRDHRDFAPRGGTSQQTESMIRKNVWLPKELSEALRAKAFHDRRSEADIVRAALTSYLQNGGGEEGQG